MTDLTNTKPPQTSSLARYSESELAGQPSWLAELRTVAVDRFGKIGFPTRRDEDWRVTPIAPIVETPFLQGELVEIDGAMLAGKDIPGALTAVFVNGRLDAELSDLRSVPDGLMIAPLSAAIASGYSTVRQNLGKHAKFDNHAFAALNTASITEGLYISVARNAVIERPIHIIYASQPGGEPTVSHPRTLVVSGEHSQVTIVERYCGPEGSVYFTNAVTEFSLADNAVVDHYKVQQESLAAFHMASMGIDLARGSNFVSHSFGFGGSIARNDISATLGGEGVEATLNGLFLAGGRQLMDSHTSLDHAMPHCPSHQVYKHILDGHARAVFNGKIFVRLDAQKTDAKQTNKTLLLSPDAQINTKPQLEIFADDVRCTHGATVGQLSEDQLFYLRARGIGKEQAQDLLIYAFAADVIQRVKVEALREELDHILLAERHMEGLS